MSENVECTRNVLTIGSLSMAGTLNVASWGVAMVVKKRECVITKPDYHWVTKYNIWMSLHGPILIRYEITIAIR
jgi:hypothetical protein